MKSVLDWEPQPPYTAEQLVEVLRILRDPDNIARAVQGENVGTLVYEG